MYAIRSYYATVTGFHVVSNEIGIVGLLKIEEMGYIIMGSLASTVMGIRMPMIDECKGSYNFV